jgi:hypothetical protein
MSGGRGFKSHAVHLFFNRGDYGTILSSFFNNCRTKPLAIIEYGAPRILVAVQKINKSEYQSGGKTVAVLLICYWVLLYCPS